MEDMNPYHTIIVRDRKILEICGVKQIDSFDSKEFLIETIKGWMCIQGNNLSLDMWEMEKGEVNIKGTIDSIRYLASKTSEKESFTKKLFK